MELTQLKQFKCIAETENMLEASEKLYVSQPSLSKAVKKLENEIGKPLFDRNNKRIRLNYYGKIAETYTDIILSELDEIVRIAKTAQQCNIYNICSNSVSIADYVLPQMCTAFPDTQIHCETNSYNLKTMLLDETFDMMITSYPLEHNDLENIFLFDENIYISVPDNNPLAQKTVINLSDLKFQTFAETKRGNPVIAIYKSPLLQKNLEIKCFYQASLETMYDFADKAGYLYFVDSVTAKNHPQTSKRVLVPYNDERGKYKFYAVYQKRNKKRLEFLVNWLKKYFD